jgi:uncharacterized membrane protein
MKNPKPIVMIGLSLLFALGLFYLRHSGFIDSFLFNTLAVICLLGVVVNVVKIMKSRKQGPEQSGKAMDGHESQTIKLRPTLAGMSCDVITAVVLFIAWVLIFREGLLGMGTDHGSNSIVICTITAILCLVDNYLPKRFGGMWEPLGIKQVKQHAIRIHAMGLVSALVVLSDTLRYLLPSNAMVKILPGILVVALIGLFIWDMSIKNVKPSQEDVEKLLDDNHSNKQ